MMEDPAVKDLQGSIAKIFVRKAQLAERFYFHLFEQMPEVKPMFTSDMMRQREMFAAMLVSSMQTLSDPDRLEEKMQFLRISHARLGLTADQLAKGANALMAALIEVMGEALSEVERVAWARAIVHLMRAMAPPGSDLELSDQTDMQIYFISR